MDSVSKDKRSGIMRLIKSKGTSLERVLRNQLWKRGIRYRKNNSTLFGKPDISIVSKNIVVFLTYVSGMVVMNTYECLIAIPIIGQ